MMFHGCPDVESGLQMGIPRAASIRFYMGRDCAPKRGEWLPHVIMLAMDVGIGGDLWGDVGLSE